MQKTWVRILISLLGGGAFSELFHIMTGDPDRPMENNTFIFGAGALLTFFIVTAIAYRKK